MIVVFSDLYWGPPVYGNCRMAPSETVVPKALHLQEAP